MPTLRKEHDKSEEGACRAQDCIAHKYGGNIAFHSYSIKTMYPQRQFPDTADTWFHDFNDWSKGAPLNDGRGGRR